MTPPRLPGLRWLIGKGLQAGLPFGKRASIAAEVVLRTTELCSVLALTMKQSVGLLLLLGILVTLLERVARRLMDPDPIAPSSSPPETP
jgi:hypothetical protein